MQVEIWSDVACPFCYLGKRRFEKALAALAAVPRAEDVSVEWKSFQLNPGLKTDPNVRIEEYLARAKGIDVATARQLNERVARMGEEDGLVYRFDKLVVANTFDAHRLIQFAKDGGKQNEVEERLFRAYFTEGRNVADRATLVELANDVGLDGDELASALEEGKHAAGVRADIDEARQLGIHGVPFFVFDRKYAVSGAQPVEVFERALGEARAASSVLRPAS